MSLDLSNDGRGGVGRETHVPGHVEPVDSLYQADHGHLDQILEQLRASPESRGQVPTERRVLLDELLTGGLVVRQPGEQLHGALVLTGRGSWDRHINP